MPQARNEKPHHECPYLTQDEYAFVLNTTHARWKPQKRANKTPLACRSDPFTGSTTPYDEHKETVTIENF